MESAGRVNCVIEKYNVYKHGKNISICSDVLADGTTSLTHSCVFVKMYSN